MSSSWSASAMIIALVAVVMVMKAVIAGGAALSSASRPTSVLGLAFQHFEFAFVLDPGAA